MNEYLNSLKESAKHVAEVLVVKTSETVDAAKLEIEMHKQQSALDKEYKALGQIMFQVEKGALKKDEAIIKTACKRIQEKIDALVELQKKKDESKEQKEYKEETVAEPDMADDDEEIDDDDVIEVPDEEVPMPERSEDGYFVLKFCPKCKVGNHPDAARCINCGTEFTKQDDSE